MIRRPLVALLVLGLSGALPAVASAASAQALLAQAPNGTLSDAPSADLIAQTPRGTLSETPTDAGTAGSGSGGSASGSSEAGTASTTTAAALPFTGSDPRVMLMLGLAALLVGAGLRLRTGDARDF